MSHPPDRESPTVAVIGGGLAGHTAAAALRANGFDLLQIYPPSPGQTGMWSGLGGVFGRDRSFPSDTTGRIGPRERRNIRLIRSRAERFERLVSERPHHPYVTTDATPKKLVDAVETALDLLADVSLTLLPDGSTLPATDGSAVTADVVATSMRHMRLTGDRQIDIVRAPGIDGWSAPTLASGIAEAPGLDAAVTDAPIFEALAGGHPVRAAAELDDVDDGREQIAAWLRDRKDTVDLVVFPPALGATPASHSKWLDALDSADAPRITEGMVHRHPTQGWRLDRALRSAHPPDRQAKVFDVTIPQDSVTAVVTGDETIEVDGVVLASGSFASGSLSTSPPFRERITETPLFLDGAPVADPSQRTVAEFTGDHPWSDHAVWRLGVGIDSALRVLGVDGEPIADNVVAAGRIVGGTNRVADGTALGVDMWTGLRAADTLEAKLNSAADSRQSTE